MPCLRRLDAHAPARRCRAQQRECARASTTFEFAKRVCAAATLPPIALVDVTSVTARQRYVYDTARCLRLLPPVFRVTTAGAMPLLSLPSRAMRVCRALIIIAIHNTAWLASLAGATLTCQRLLLPLSLPIFSRTFARRHCRADAACRFDAGCVADAYAPFAAAWRLLFAYCCSRVITAFCLLRACHTRVDAATQQMI